MSADVYKPFSRDLAALLIRMDHPRRREVFRVVVEFLRRETGLPFPSVYDFLSSNDSRVSVEKRQALLSTALAAVKDGNLAALEAG